MTWLRDRSRLRRVEKRDQHEHDREAKSPGAILSENVAIQEAKGRSKSPASTRKPLRNRRTGGGSWIFGDHPLQSSTNSDYIAPAAEDN